MITLGTLLQQLEDTGCRRDETIVHVEGCDTDGNEIRLIVTGVTRRGGELLIQANPVAWFETNFRGDAPS